MKFRFSAFLTAFLFSVALHAQVATGTYPLGTFDPLGFDTINVGNLNVMFNVPVIHKPGRGGTNFNYDLEYNGAIWNPSSGAWKPDQNWGWSGQTAILTGYLYEHQMSGICRLGSGRFPYFVTDRVAYYDAVGVVHRFNGRIQDSFGSCPGDDDTLSNTTSDDGKYHIGDASNNFQLTDTQGHIINAPINTTNGAATYTDTNGNQISVDSSGHFTDTSGSVALTVSGSAPSNQVYTYTGTDGLPRYVTVSYHTYNVKTNFGCSGVTEYSASSISLVDTITTGDSGNLYTYSFQYEPTPGFSGYVTGRVQSVTLPSGGTISYTYTGSNNGINCADGSTAGLTRTLTSLSGTPSRSYSRTISGSNSHTLLINETNGYFDYDFVKATGTSTSPLEIYQTKLVVTQGGTGTPPLSSETCYNLASQPCTTQTISVPITTVDQYSTWDGVVQNGYTATYDTQGNQTEMDYYDYGTSSRGGIVSSTQNTFSSGYLVDTISYDGPPSTGQKTSRTTYTYGAGTVSTTGVPQHNAAYGSFGNLTGIQYFSDPNAFSYSQSVAMTYDDTGSLITSGMSYLPSSTTTYGYDNATNTYRVAVTPPSPNSVSLASTNTFDSHLGVQLTSTDANGKVVATSLHDAFSRPGEVDIYAGATLSGKTTYQYTPTQTTVRSYQASSVYTETDSLSDAYGRTIQIRVQADSGRWYTTNTCYDTQGRVIFVSYPIAGSTSSPSCSGNGDHYQYDVLSRAKRIDHDDEHSTYATKSYFGSAVLYTDENAHSRIIQTDTLGRNRIVCEVSSSPLAGGDTPSSCGTLITGSGFSTTYSYSANKVTISQGSQTRRFEYDGMGRLVAKLEPEIRNPGNPSQAMTVYSYSYSSTGPSITRSSPKANQTNPTVSTSSTTQYDWLARVISVTYTDGLTPNKYFTYDQGLSGSTFTYGAVKGLLTSAYTSLGDTTEFSHDVLGRTTGTAQCVSAWCSTPSLTMFHSYGYNWQNSRITESFSTPGGTPSFTIGRNLTGQITSISGGQDPIVSSLYTANAASMTAYGPVSGTLGNGLSWSSGYSARGKQNAFTLGSGPSYSWNTDWKASQLLSSSDSVNGANTSNSFDEFGRITGSTIDLLNLSWTYDRYGNRWSQSASGSYGGTVAQPSLTFDAVSNHISTSGYAYDAAGNLSADPLHTYTYDADGKILSVDGGSTEIYTYDALDNRVKVVFGGSTTRIFSFDIDGNRTAMWDNSGNLLSARYYIAGRPYAYFYAADGHVHFEHQDWLGTERMRTAYSATPEASFTSLPFGDSLTGSPDNDSYHFANMDHYPSGLDHATYRDYSSLQGRWLRPDPSDNSYDFSDPQSLNRYAYISNNPLSFIDPLGLERPKTTDSIDVNCDCGDGVSLADIFNMSIGSLVPTIPFIEIPIIPREAPNEGPQEPPPPCQAKILNATNNQFGTNYTDANVSSTFNYSTGAGPGQGTLNLNITGSTAGVSPGYYPIHRWTYVIGYGSTLHAVSGPGGHGGLDSQMTVPFGPNQATFHIDSGYPYNPVGAFFHWLLNMTKVGGYPKC